MTSLHSPIKRARQEPKLDAVTPIKKTRKEEKINIVSPEPEKSKQDFLREVDSEEFEQKYSSTIELSQAVKAVYKIVQKSTGATGGNGYNGAIYGELTAGSMQKVVDFLENSCDLNGASRFIDVGAGLGKPNFHVLQSPQVCLSIGVELEEIRWILSMHNLRSYLTHLANKDASLAPNHRINFIHADIDEAATLDPFTHIYMYDLGFPPPLQKSIAEKFNESVHARYLISYRPPRRVIHEYGYSVEHIHQMNTKMFGSGESHMAYFYRRVGSMPSKSKQSQIEISQGTERIRCYCDDRFRTAIEETHNLMRLKERSEEIVSQHLNSARATRRSSHLSL